MSNTKIIFPSYLKDAQEAASLASCAVKEARSKKDFARFKCNEASKISYSDACKLSDIESYYKAYAEFNFAQKVYSDACIIEEKTQSDLVFLQARYKCVCTASILSEEGNEPSPETVKAYYKALDEYNLITASYLK